MLNTSGFFQSRLIAGKTFVFVFRSGEMPLSSGRSFAPVSAWCSEMPPVSYA